MEYREARTDSTFAKLMKDLREHMNQEETSDLPKFEAAISREESCNLGKSFNRTKNFVPTRFVIIPYIPCAHLDSSLAFRSHPSAPDKPPFETVAGLLAAPLDKLKDLFRAFPSETEVHRACP